MAFKCVNCPKVSLHAYATRRVAGTGTNQRIRRHRVCPVCKKKYVSMEWLYSTQHEKVLGLCVRGKAEQIIGETVLEDCRKYEPKPQKAPRKAPWKTREAKAAALAQRVVTVGRDAIVVREGRDSAREVMKALRTLQSVEGGGP